LSPLQKVENSKGVWAKSTRRISEQWRRSSDFGYENKLIPQSSQFSPGNRENDGDDKSEHCRAKQQLVDRHPLHVVRECDEELVDAAHWSASAPQNIAV
jgi:hypothetical protein